MVMNCLIKKKGEDDFRMFKSGVKVNQVEWNVKFQFCKRFSISKLEMFLLMIDPLKSRSAETTIITVNEPDLA